MKYRYLIERGPDSDPYRPFYLTTITKEDTGGNGHACASIAAAKETAAKDPNTEGGIRWRDAPREWQPDAIAISQWLDDDVEDNRDA